MSEKFLNEADWKKFSKSRDYKDAALLKALAALEKAEAAAPPEQLKALDELDKQSAALLKQHKGDKELSAYLADLDKAAQKLRRQLEKDAKDAKKDSQDGGEDEEDSPALLTTKLLPLLREVRKGAAVHSLVGLAGSEAVVLLSRRTISPGLRKLLAAELGVSGGIKYLPGNCLFEENAFTFVVQTQASGLAKKLKAALLKQVGQRLKVRVRGDDPNDVDEDLEGGESDADAGEAAPGTSTGTTTDAPAGPPSDAPSPEAQAQALASFKARMAGQTVALKAALGAGQAGGAEQKERLAEAVAAAGKKAFDRANALLDLVDAWLRGAGNAPGTPAAPTTPPQAPTAPAPDPGQAPGPSLVVLQQSRLVWDALRKKIQGQLQTLEKTVLDEIRAHNADEANQEGYDESEVAGRLRQLWRILERLDARLIDKLDQALNASGAERQRLNAEAAQLVAEYQAYVEADAQIAEVDANGFLETSIRADAQRTLAQLASRLQAA